MMFLNKANVRVTLRKNSHVQTDLAWHILRRHILRKESLSWCSNARLMHAPLPVPCWNHVACLGHMLESPTCPETQTRICIRRLCPEPHIYRKAWIYRSSAYHVLNRLLSRQILLSQILLCVWAITTILYCEGVRVWHNTFRLDGRRSQWCAR